jgi:hypothetical protein
VHFPAVACQYIYQCAVCTGNAFTYSEFVLVLQAPSAASSLRPTRCVQAARFSWTNLSYESTHRLCYLWLAGTIRSLKFEAHNQEWLQLAGPEAQAIMAAAAAAAAASGPGWQQQEHQQHLVR